MSWPLSTIAESCILVTDGTHYTPPDVREGMPFLTVKDVLKDGSLDLDGCSRISREEFRKAEQGNSVPKRGDVLFSKDGTVGKVHVVDGRDQFAVLSSLAILRPDPARLDSRYFGWILKSESCIDQAIRSKTGSAIRRIILRDLCRVNFPIPPLAEQKRIAGILDAADALRAKRREALAQLDSLLQATFLDMFGDPIGRGVRWPTAPMSQVCMKVTDGTHFSPPIVSEGIPYITAKHLKPHGLDFESDPWFIARKDHEDIYRRCDPVQGDVLYIKDGATTGIAAINRYDFEFSMLSSLALLRPDPKHLTPEYLSSWLNNPMVKRELLGGMAGAAIRRFTIAKIKQFTVPIPPLSHQQEFSRIVLGVTMQKRLQSLHLAELDTLFASLQSRAFRGEL